jgi:hypothetical protein
MNPGKSDRETSKMKRISGQWDLMKQFLGRPKEKVRTWRRKKIGGRFEQEFRKSWNRKRKEEGRRHAIVIMAPAASDSWIQSKRWPYKRIRGESIAHARQSDIPVKIIGSQNLSNGLGELEKNSDACSISSGTRGARTYSTRTIPGI